MDTDVASLIQKRRQPPWMDRHLSGSRIWLTFVTVGELAKLAEVRAWGRAARGRLDHWIGARGVVPYDEEVARAWGRLAARAQLRVGRARTRIVSVRLAPFRCCGVSFDAVLCSSAPARPVHLVCTWNDEGSARAELLSHLPGLFRWAMPDSNRRPPRCERGALTN